VHGDESIGNAIRNNDKYWIKAIAIQIAIVIAIETWNEMAFVTEYLVFITLPQPLI